MVGNWSIESIGFSSAAKLFLFGVEETPVIIPGKSGRRRLRRDFGTIEKAINLWAEKRGERKGDFSFDDLSNGTLVSVPDLKVFFKEYMHSDFRTWKLRLRIYESMDYLLEDQDTNVSVIADRLGFKDISNFHRRFKQIAGCTPYRWRHSGGHPELDK